MLFRKATIEDAESVAYIYDQARKEFAALGIPQWQNGVPGKDSFLSDVNDGTSFVLTEDGKIAGTVQIVGYEPTYEKVDGGSFSTDSYLAAHRVAVSPDFRRRGVGGLLLAEAEKIAGEKGKGAVRIDTHENNFRMRALLSKNGFRAVGTIYLADGSPRIAYEKLI